MSFVRYAKAGQHDDSALRKSLSPSYVTDVWCNRRQDRGVVVIIGTSELLCNGVFLRG